MRWLKKSSKEPYASDFVMAQNLNHYSLNSITNFEPFQHFRAKKVSYFGKKARDQYFEKKNEGSNFEPSQNQMHMPARHVLHVSLAPSMNF